MGTSIGNHIRIPDAHCHSNHKALRMRNCVAFQCIEARRGHVRGISGIVASRDKCCFDVDSMHRSVHTLNLRLVR